ncbi:MAG: T9SS type A sorting domain-containing protein, partial [Bacteroidota bacterium]
ILGVDNDPNDGNETRPDTVETLMISNRDTQANRLLSEENFSRIFDFDSVVLTSEVVFIDNNSSNVQEIPGTVVDLIINDTIRQDYLLQDFYAYDDGSAEFAAGTNVSNGQIAVKFWVEQADTLTHIDINFPNISPNQNGTSINLNVYTKLDSTGLLRTQQVSVINNITRDAFTRYRLDRPVIVSDTFFIGYQQFINDFLPVGFDRSNPEASQYIFENRNDGWIQNISLRGALMIRPVFSDSTVVILAQEDVPKPTTPEFNVYPNPSKGTIQIEGKYDKIELLDLSGRILLSERNAPSHQLNHDPGIYLLRVYHGNDFEIKKIILDSSP